MNEEKEKIEEAIVEEKEETEAAETASAALKDSLRVAAGTPHPTSLQNDCHLPGREHSSLPALATNVPPARLLDASRPMRGRQVTLKRRKAAERWRS